MMAKLYLYKSRVRKDEQGRPLWVKCESEAGCIQMSKNGLEVKMIEFKGSIPRPAHKDFELEGVGFGAKKKRKRKSKRQRRLERKEFRQQRQEDDGIISIKRHGSNGKKKKNTKKRQRGRRRR